MHITLASLFLYTIAHITHYVAHEVSIQIVDCFVFNTDQVHHILRSRSSGIPFRSLKPFQLTPDEMETAVFTNTLRPDDFQLEEESLFSSRRNEEGHNNTTIHHL
jgi:hypothetical protein